MTALNTLLPFVLIIIVGFITSKRKILPDSFPTSINIFLFNVAIPLFLIGSFQEFDRAELKNFFPFILVNFIIITVLYLIFYFILARVKMESAQKAALLTPSFIGNTLFFGFPILLSLFGPVYASYSIIYVAFVTNSDYIGMFLTSRITGSEFKLKDQIFDFIKTPIFISVIIGLSILILNIQLPALLLQVTESFGNIISTLIMFSFGMYIAQNFKFAGLKLSLISSSIKLLILPLVTYLIVYYVFPLDTTAAQTSVILACTPAAFFNLLISDNFKTDRELTISTILISSMLFFVTILLWVNIIS